MHWSIRTSGTRSLISARRALSTTTDPSSVSNALSTLGSIGPGLEISATNATATNASASPVPAPVLMNIPPPEDPLLHYLTSALLTNGHRAKAARITSRTLLYIHAFTRSPSLPILRQAILSASPAVRCMMHRQGAKNVAKPVALGEKQRTRFAVQWILSASEKKSGKSVEERLAREIIGVVRGESEALRKKEEVHRFAMVNRGNAQWRV